MRRITLLYALILASILSACSSSHAEPEQREAAGTTFLLFHTDRFSPDIDLVSCSDVMDTWSVPAGAQHDFLKEIVWIESYYNQRDPELSQYYEFSKKSFPIFDWARERLNQQSDIGVTVTWREYYGKLCTAGRLELLERPAPEFWTPDAHSANVSGSATIRSLVGHTWRQSHLVCKCIQTEAQMGESDVRN